MNAGWKALGVKGAWMAADAGELYLRQRFDPNEKDYKFSTALEAGNKIKLTLHKQIAFTDKITATTELVEFEEDADTFVSEDTVTKIMLITGRG